jgi:hypothetical protein
MGKKNQRNKNSSLLYRRLKTALNDGIKVWFETRDKSYFGVPIAIDRKFVEILVLVPGSEEDASEYAFQRVTWIVRLSSISSIAYPTEYWSTDRLEDLFAREIAKIDFDAKD